MRGVDEEFVDSVGIGNEEGLVGEDVVGVYRTREGGTAVLPKGMAVRLSRRGLLEDAVRLEEASADLIRARARLDEVARECRRVGLPWEVVAWCTGLSVAGARKRWGTEA